MNVVYLVLGVSLLVVGTVDILWTTLWVQGGAGPLTSRLMKGEWKILRRIVGHRLAVLTLSGPLILTISLATWICLLWGGWTLIFASGESVLLNVTRGGPLSWAERLYCTRTVDGRSPGERIREGVDPSLIVSGRGHTHLSSGILSTRPFGVLSDRTSVRFG